MEGWGSLPLVLASFLFPRLESVPYFRFQQSNERGGW
jgi:hypothetical protein